MEHAHQHRPEDPPGPVATPPFWRSRYAVGLIVFGAVAAYFLLSEHRAHFLGALPFLILLACPLMHVFMHHGHGSHSTNDAGPSGDQPSAKRPGTLEADKSRPGDQP